MLAFFTMSTLGKKARHNLLLLSLIVCGTGFLVVGGTLLAIALAPTPDIASFASRQVDQSTKIYDRTGQVLLYDYNRDARREVVSLANISPNAVSAIIATEDSSFYQHGGIRVTSIIRALIADVLGTTLSQGGSTITQQVVKNTLLTTKKSVVRKVNEWVLAVKLEQQYSKDQILEIYLNNIPYGSTLYGIEAASGTYFGVTSKDLTLTQAAYLAAMIQRPSYYSPYGKNRELLDARALVVLERMRTLGFITEEAYTVAKETPVAFAAESRTSIVAPHFVFYILDYLTQKYGPQALVGGLKVTTTLDADLEVRAESILADYAEVNKKNFNASNASLVATDPATGQILAMVGSHGFFDTEIDGQFNAALALRQPGSTMKPFIYALALERGYTRNTVVFDVPTQFSTACNAADVTNSTPPCYAPQNYDEKFRGPMTLETALAQSINIPAVKVLYLAGIQNAINLAESFGLTSLGNAAQYGLTLVLGGGEVRLLDLTNAYAALGNGGVRNAATGILSVSDNQGTLLEQYTPNPVQVLSSATANDINAMLSNPYARLPEYPLNSPLSFPGYEVAVKTGTTNDTRDAWVVGYTPSVAIGIWTGNNDNSKMVKSVAGFIAAPMWHEVMAYALTKYPKTYFNEPSQIFSSFPPILQGNWQVPDETGAIVPHDLLYWTNKNNPRGPKPTNPGADAQFTHWEYGVQAYYGQRPDLFINPPLMVPVSPGAPTE